MCRVNYDKENWRLIAKTLLNNHTAIHVVNRAQIMDDAFNLAKSGLLDYDTALSMTGYLSKELEYIPWKAALSGFEYIKTMLRATPAYGEFKRYMLSLIKPIYNKLGFNTNPSDTHLQTLLRKIAVKWACSMGHKECIKFASNKFAAWMKISQPDRNDANPIDLNLRYGTYCSAISSGGEEEFNFAWQRYKNSQVPTEKKMLLQALSCTKEVWLLNRYLHMSITPSSGVRKADGYRVIGHIASNSIGQSLAFDFIKEEWDTVHKAYGKGAWGMRHLIKHVLSDRNKNVEIKSLKAFEAEYGSELGTSRQTVKQAIEGAEANIAWMKKNYEIVWNWLKLHNIKLDKDKKEENVWNALLN